MEFWECKKLGTLYVVMLTINNRWFNNETIKMKYYAVTKLLLNNYVLLLWHL